MRKLFFFILLCLVAVGYGQSFRRGALYSISHVPLEYDGQLVQISQLSGAWRLVDPFTHRALRMSDRGMTWGEENGSDELQKWTIKPVGKDQYQFTPTNAPQLADKSKRHTILEASVFGSDDNCTYRFRSVAHPNMVLGNGDDGGNNAHIVAETLDSLNRGQYWAIKTLKKGVHVVMGSFYNQNFDDGGNNAHINYLLQWPATPGQWGNALMNIKPVEGQKGIYQIVSHNKQRMFTLCEGQMKIADLNAQDKQSWFYIDEVEKPKIKSPLWEDETIFAQNKLHPIANYMPYPTEAQMVADQDYYVKPWTEPKSTAYQSLDGIWRFSFATSPDQKPDGLSLSENDNSVFDPWDNIRVPGCWEMQGYDRPIYCNVEYPHSNTPPYIKARPGFNDGGKNYAINPVGTYQRTFRVEEDWTKQRTIIHFGGIYSAAFVYLNGNYVGYTQGSNNVAEFDITPYITMGDNNLVVQVLRWCDGSYLECQDMFRMSGIHRSVYLYNVPTTSIRDHQITANFNANYSQADINIKLQREGNGSVGNVVVKLFDPQGTEVGQTDATLSANGTYSAQLAVDNPQLWTAETPTLYTLHFIQYDQDGNEQMAFATKYGLRKIEIRNSLVYINGKRVLFKGVNRHDTDPETGRTVSVASMERDVVMMKQNNINTIRTSHYPSDIKMFRMFDYYGLYACAEADLENHANQSISNIPSWIPAFTDRIERMVGTYRNHPSVVMWSLGNESGPGSNFKDCYEVAHHMDATRPVHYEGSRTNKDYGGSLYSDFYSKMYPSMLWMEKNTSGLDKPMFICEYAHAMGNAIGNLNHYWQTIATSDACVGGCIWDWVDQAIYEPLELKKGIRRLHTGYDFPGPHQGNFCSNGIVTAERDYTSKLAEVKYAQQFISFKRLEDKGNNICISVKNDYVFTSLEGVDIKYEFIVNGKPTATKIIRLNDVQPDSCTIVMIPQPKIKHKENVEVMLNLYALYGNDNLYAKKGDDMAKAQFAISNVVKLPFVKVTKDILNTTETAESLLIHNKNISVEFDKTTGRIGSLKLQGRELLAQKQGFVFDNHRWIENDRFARTANGLAAKGEIKTSHSADNFACSVITSRKGEIADQQIIYNIYGSGIVDLEVIITPHSNELRRAGVVCAIDTAFSNVDYYALGPWENYPDRYDAVTLGRYSTTVDKLGEKYIKPQTTGDRGGLRELTLSDQKGFGIKIQAQGDVSFSANRYTDEDLMNAQHQWELKKRPFIYLHLDGAQRGLGNASCGPGPMQRYTISNEQITYRLRISKK